MEIRNHNTWPWPNTPLVAGGRPPPCDKPLVAPAMFQPLSRGILENAPGRKPCRARLVARTGSCYKTLSRRARPGTCYKPSVWAVATSQREELLLCLPLNPSIRGITLLHHLSNERLQHAAFVPNVSLRASMRGVGEEENEWEGGGGSGSGNFLVAGGRGGVCAWGGLGTLLRSQHALSSHAYDMVLDIFL